MKHIVRLLSHNGRRNDIPSGSEDESRATQQLRARETLTNLKAKKQKATSGEASNPLVDPASGLVVVCGGISIRHPRPRFPWQSGCLYKMRF